MHFCAHSSSNNDSKSLASADATLQVDTGVSGIRGKAIKLLKNNKKKSLLFFFILAENRRDAKVSNSSLGSTCFLSTELILFTSQNFFPSFSPYMYKKGTQHFNPKSCYHLLITYCVDLFWWEIFFIICILLMTKRRK